MLSVYLVETTANGGLGLSDLDSSRNGVACFRTIQQSPVASIGVVGEKWGGGAEFTYFLDLRYDVRAFASAAQVSIAKLALEYCDGLVEDTALRDGFFEGDFLTDERDIFFDKKVHLFFELDQL